MTEQTNPQNIKVGDFVRLNDRWFMSGERNHEGVLWPNIGDVCCVAEIQPGNERFFVYHNGLDTWPVDLDECDRVELKAIPPPESATDSLEAFRQLVAKLIHELALERHHHTETKYQLDKERADNVTLRAQLRMLRRNS